MDSGSLSIQTVFAESRARFERAADPFMPEKGASADMVRDFTIICQALHDATRFMHERIEAAETIIGHTLPSHPRATEARTILIATARQEGERASPDTAATAALILARHCSRDFVLRHGIGQAFADALNTIDPAQRCFYTGTLTMTHPLAPFGLE